MQSPGLARLAKLDAPRWAFSFRQNCWHTLSPGLVVWPGKDMTLFSFVSPFLVKNLFFHIFFFFFFFFFGCSPAPCAPLRVSCKRCSCGSAVVVEVDKTAYDLTGMFPGVELTLAIDTFFLDYAIDALCDGIVRGLVILGHGDGYAIRLEYGDIGVAAVLHPGLSDG